MRHLLDLDADPGAVGAVLGADPALGPLVAERPGLRVPGRRVRCGVGRGGVGADVVHWRAIGFPAWSTVAGVLALFGLPAVLWLWFEHRTPAPRPLPRPLWAGLALVVVGLGGGLVVSASTSQGAGRLAGSVGAPPIAFAPVPVAARAALAVAFPNLVPKRAVHAADIYEVWLGRPDNAGYSLQVTWTRTPSGSPRAPIEIDNLDWNTAYRARAGTPLPLPSLARRVGARRGLPGPFVFPGYVVYLSPSQGTETAVDRMTGLVVSQEGL